MYTFSQRGEILCRLWDLKSEYVYIQLKTLSMCPFYHQLDQHRAVEKPLKGLVMMRYPQSLVKVN